MKKILLVFLFGSILIGSLFAGGSSSATKVQYWAHVENAWNESQNQIIARFNAQRPEVQVVPTYYPYDDFEAKIMSSLISGRSGADLYEMWGGWALDFIANGTLSQVPQDLIQNLLNDCYEPVLGGLRGPDGNYYGVPMEFNIEWGGIFVNKAEFTKRGIAYPTTWDEIISIAKQTAVSSGNSMTMRGFDFVDWDSLTYYILADVLSNGGQYWVNNKINLTSPAFVAAVTKYANYVTQDKITNLDGLTGAQGDLESIDFLGMNQSMMVPRGPWARGWLEEDYNKVYGTDIEYIAVPFPGSTQAFAAETGWSMAVAKKSKVTEAAWGYVRYLFMPDNLKAYNIACGALPPSKTVANDPSFRAQVPYMGFLIDILPYGKFIGPFNTDVLKEHLADAFVDICGGQNIQTRLQVAETQINRDLGL